MHNIFGDFQTPLPLVKQVLAALDPVGRRWSRVLEPTCGRGNFLRGITQLTYAPREVIGIELNREYVMEARETLSHFDVGIRHANIFDIDLGRDLEWRSEGHLLVVGNPPWVTNSSQGLIGGKNLPAKKNLKRLPGMQAMTGESNFDIAEYIILKLIHDLNDMSPTIALLCKTSVARNIVQHCFKNSIQISDIEIRLIDAKSWFNASVDACLFVLNVNQNSSSYEVKLYSDLSSSCPERHFGYSGGKFVSDLEKYQEVSFADGACPLMWRQGIKHDASNIMEFERCADGRYANGEGYLVSLGGEYVYPLLKSSDLNAGRIVSSRKFVIVTQHSLGESTSNIQYNDPLLWRYLQSNVSTMRARKSSIYKNQPDFAMFGIGDYSFAKAKVAISGLYKTPKFRLLGSIHDKPIMLDDTCYFLPFDDLQVAAVVAAVLNDAISLNLIDALVFWDAKRRVISNRRGRGHAGVQEEPRPS